ncbi:MAG: hypothetical protein AAF383_00860 [Cyanobacteria bacterium P01_A01_bin.83]
MIVSSVFTFATINSVFNVKVDGVVTCIPRETICTRTTSDDIVIL